MKKSNLLFCSLVLFVILGVLLQWSTPIKAVVIVLSVAVLVDCAKKLWDNRKGE